MHGRFTRREVVRGVAAAAVGGNALIAGEVSRSSAAPPAGGVQGMARIGVGPPRGSQRAVEASGGWRKWDVTHTRLRGWVLVGLVLGAGACARVDPQPEWKSLEGMAQERTGTVPLWERSEADASAIRGQVDALLADGLTRDDAIRIALSNNRGLQATFQDIGVAKADLVQAGLLTNPSLDVALLFPLNLDDSAAELLVMLSDLWSVPARERVAAVRTEEAIRRVGMAVVETANVAADWYDEVLYRMASLDLERAVLQIRTESAERTKGRPGSGLANDLDISRADSEVFDQEISVARAERDLRAARAQLDLVLSLTEDQRQYQILGALDTPPPDTWTVQTAVAFALEHRLDVAVARLEVERRQREVAYERTQVFSQVAVGPGYDGAFGSDDAGGPVIGLELPIFDQNQAQIAKAQYRLRQAQLQLAANELRARTEVENVLAEIAFRAQQVEIIHDRLEPIRRRAVEYAERWSAGMQMTFLDVLHARAQEIATRREHLAALWQLRRAQVHLRRVLWSGGRDDT